MTGSPPYLDYYDRLVKMDRAAALALLDAYLADGGVAVHMLGEGLPAEAVLGLMDQVDAGWLCLSCTLDIHLPDAARLIRRVRQARPDVRVAVGGAALRDRGEPLRRRLAADFTAPNLLGVRRDLPAWLRETPGPTAP